ncbi:hypothetical protein Syun_026408 [Stephania yunnanensis]|uniref:ADP/ATP translocase n=1 Tax=Stephania yunnanensis TaxID=152371 RepID=A0AAP0EZ09_9MAGN
MREGVENLGERSPAAIFQRDLMAGAAMGGVVHTIVAPIERAKLLLQTQESNIGIVGGGGQHRRFKGMVDVIVRTVREEGVVSLWRGNGSSVLRHYPSVALNFSLKWRITKNMITKRVFREDYHFPNKLKRAPSLDNSQNDPSPILTTDLYRNILRGEKSSDSRFMSGAPINFVAGAAAGCTTLIIVYPLDIAHTRLAADVGNTNARQFKGIIHFLSTIRQTDGIRGIYRGLPASLHGMIVHRGIYFGGFDTAKEMMSEDSRSEPALWKRWIVAQAVTTSAGLLSYPLDTVRRRMMMQSGLQQPMYRSTLDCWKKIYKLEGVRSFYRGAFSNMFRSTGAAAILVLYDEMKKFFNWDGL